MCSRAQMHVRAPRKRRTSENSVKRKSNFREYPFHALGWIGIFGTLAASLSPYRCEHPLWGIQLVDHPIRSGLDRILRMDHLRGRADYKNPSARVHLPQIAHEPQAVTVGQPTVEERNVYAFKHRAGFGKRTCLTHHLQIRLSLQQADEGHPEVAAVVYH